VFRPNPIELGCHLFHVLLQKLDPSYGDQELVNPTGKKLQTLQISREFQ
jgi:hypothetical protein